MAAGVIGEDHLRGITAAIDRLPSCVSAADRDEVEASLVREATKNDADIVIAAAKRVDAIFNPDGDYDEADRARRRGVVLAGKAVTACRGCRHMSTPKRAPTSKPPTAAVRPGRHLPDGTVAESAR